MGKMPAELVKSGLTEPAEHRGVKPQASPADSLLPTSMLRGLPDEVNPVAGCGLQIIHARKVGNQRAELAAQHRVAEERLA